MAIRTWQHYFEGEKPDSNPNESFYNLSGTNQLRIQAKRALETDNIEFFFSEDGTTIQHHLAALTSEERQRTQELLAAAQRTPIPRSPVHPQTPTFQQFQQHLPQSPVSHPFQPAELTWNPEVAQAQADFAHEQAMKTHFERLKMENQFKHDFEFRKLHNAALISAVPQFDRQRDTVSLNDFLDSLVRIIAPQIRSRSNFWRPKCLRRLNSGLKVLIRLPV